MRSVTNWFQVPLPEVRWLVEGLITADGHTGVSGKPKCGKSQVVRNLVAAVVKSEPFLGRKVCLPPKTGKVLYVHLDRKDSIERVYAELRRLGVTEEESRRIAIATEKDLPLDGTMDDRFKWLQAEVREHKPHLVVIDLLWQFIRIDGSSNDYNKVLDKINELQDELRKCHYGGALVVVMHARKATNPNEPMDDMLGSTGHRGSFGTNLMLSRRRDRNIYTILSDQTDRDDEIGEIPETIIERASNGKLTLGPPLADVLKADRQVRSEDNVHRLLDYLSDHPGIEMTAIVEGIGISKKTAIKLVGMAGELIVCHGKGVKGDPHLYSVKNLAARGINTKEAVHG